MYSQSWCLLLHNRINRSNTLLLKFGLHTIKEIKGMFSFLLTATVLVFLFSPLNALLPYFVNVYHLGNASNLAQTLAFFQIGLMVGSIISFSKKQWKRKINGIIIFIYIQFIGIIILMLAPRGNFLILGIGMLIIGVCEPIFQTLLMTIFQTSVPLEKQGRIMSIVMTITHIAAPFGILISGPITDIIGIIPLLLFCIILGIITFTFSIVITDMRKIEGSSTVVSTVSAPTNKEIL